MRPEVRDAVALCQHAAIVVRMVTGDHPETAKFIARECGILTNPSHIVLEGSEFRQLQPVELAKIVPNLRVLARSRCVYVSDKCLDA